MQKITYPGTGDNSTLVYDGLGHNVEIVETRSGSVTATQQFVSCGNERCEARSSGGSITAQFFSLGETIGSTICFYTTDKPGSIREMTNSSGALEAQYSYDPYGRPTLLHGSIASDRQFAGYYFHAPSGMNLTTYRAYSSNVGRWLNRDPIKENGGTNLFAYVANEPVGFRDPLGLAGIGINFGAGGYAGLPGLGAGATGSIGFGGFSGQSSAFNVGSYVSGGGFFNVGPLSGRTAHCCNPSAFGGGIGGAVAPFYTTADSLSDLAGPFQTTVYTLGLIEIQHSYGPGLLGQPVDIYSASPGLGLGVEHLCTNTASQRWFSF